MGCESCHGPASEYREIHKKKMLDFKSAETRAAGQTYASKGDKVCEKCHNTDSPFKPSVDKKYVFDLKERLKTGTDSFHQIVPLEGNHGDVWFLDPLPDHAAPYNGDLTQAGRIQQT